MDAAFLPPTVLSGGIVEPLHHPCTVVKRQMRSPASVLHSNRVSMTVRTRTEEYGFSNPSFVDSVSGEWFGYECAFSVQGGEPRNIPERYVPDEYRNWGVEIKGFDCLTSSTCLEDGSLLLKRTRALPSVGCEADAIVPEVVEHHYLSVQDDTINGGFPDGSINCGPASITDDHAQRWRVCLVDPSEDVRSRIRVEFGLVNKPFGEVTVFLEHWDSAYCGGKILPGCGGSNQSFATDPKLDPSIDLSGTWDIESQTYIAGKDGWELQSSTFDVTRESEEAGKDIDVALPRGVSVGIETLNDESICVTAGWLVKEGLRIVSRRKYASGGNLFSVSRAVEKKRP